MALPMKYKGKTFAEVAKEISSKYEDRYDPVSLNGLNSEMDQLKAAQEQEKAMMEAAQQEQMGGYEVMTNSGMGFNPGTAEPEGTFNRAQSATYNKKFADGGWFADNDAYLGLAMQAAPAITGAIQLANLEKASPVDRHLVDTGSFLGQLQKYKPRQSYFEDIDFNDIERGLVDASSRFTANNANASMGNAGRFVSNELANQNQLLKAISSARLNAQVQNRETDKLNAGEQARIDQIMAGQASQSAQLGFRGALANAQIKSRADELDAANLAAYEDRKATLEGEIGQNVGTIGKTMFDNARLEKMYGYNIFGDYVSGTEKEREKIIDDVAEKEGVSKEEAKSLMEEFLMREAGIKESMFANGGQIDPPVSKGITYKTLQNQPRYYAWERGRQQYTNPDTGELMSFNDLRNNFLFTNDPTLVEKYGNQTERNTLLAGSIKKDHERIKGLYNPDDVVTDEDLRSFNEFLLQGSERRTGGKITKKKKAYRTGGKLSTRLKNVRKG